MTLVGVAMTRSFSTACPVLLGCHHSKSKSQSEEHCDVIHQDLIVRETSLGTEVIIFNTSEHEGDDKHSGSIVEERIIPITAQTLDSTDNGTNIVKSIRKNWTDPLSTIFPSFDRNCFDFPFFTDRKTIMCLKNNKARVMFIMRGLSGSGKSSIVDVLRSTYDAVTCSADDYFLSEDGGYNFDVSKLGNAHGYCQHKARTACEKGASVVVVDNTNVKRWEMKSYLATAKSFGYVVVLVEPKTSWKFNPEELVLRNKHGVPLEVLQKKVNSFDHIIPFYYGWFLSPSKSDDLISLSSKIFMECLDHFPAFQKELWKELGMNNSCEYFTKDVIRKMLQTYYSEGGKTSSLLHCTSRFCGNGKFQSGKKYSERKDVLAACGRVFQLSLVGLVMTKRTCGARVTLDNDEKSFFERPEESNWKGGADSLCTNVNNLNIREEDGTSIAASSLSSSSMPESMGGSQGGSKKGKKSKKEKKMLAREKKLARLEQLSRQDEEMDVEEPLPSELINVGNAENQSDSTRNNTKVETRSSLSDLVNARIADKKISECGNDIGDKESGVKLVDAMTDQQECQPSADIHTLFPELHNSGFARSAHITLKTARGVESKETNFDVLHACDIENCKNSFSPSEFKSVTSGSAVYFGDGVCCVYFYQPIKINAVFSGYY